MKVKGKLYKNIEKDIGTHEGASLSTGQISMHTIFAVKVHFQRESFLELHPICLRWVHYVNYKLLCGCGTP